MPKPIKLHTATFEEVWLDKQGKELPKTPKGKKLRKFQVQFNPQTLKLNYSNQKSGGEQPKGSSTQFVGRGVTKLALELWFDIGIAEAQGVVSGGQSGKRDVRGLTQQIAYFMIPQDTTVGKKKDSAPPSLRFHWGTFTFIGVMDSMDETLEFFSSDGKPLRASVSVSISKQEIQYDAKAAATLKNPQAAGLQEYTPAPAGKTLQQMAAQSGNSDWKGLALANGIENPRLMAAGALLNFSANLSANAQLGVTAQTSGSINLSANVGLQGGASASASLGFVAGSQASAGSGLSVQADASASLGGSAGFGGSASFGADASFGGSASLSAEASLGADASVSADAGF